MQLIREETLINNSDSFSAAIASTTEKVKNDMNFTLFSQDSGLLTPAPFSLPHSNTTTIIKATNDNCF